MKRGLRRRLVITIILMLISSIVAFGVRPKYQPALSLTPLLIPTAQYLEGAPLQPSTLFSFSILHGQPCVGVNEGELLYFGTTHEELRTHVMSNLNISIDNHQIERIYLFFSTGGPLNTKYDDEGNFIGTYGYVTACVDRELERGLHLTFVSLPDIQGNIHTYTWAFRIEPTPDA